EHVVVGREFVDAVHELGVSASCWTVDDPAQAAHLAGIGLDSITTNRVTATRDGVAAGAVDQRDRQLRIATELAGWAAAVTGRARRDGVGTVQTKSGPADHVTEIDRLIERRVRAVIGAQFDDHDLVGEEYGGSADGSRPCWYVDPIDGTANLANGVPWTSFSLALVERGRPVVGAVVDPSELVPITAAEGRGAWRAGRRLRTTPRPGAHPLSGAIVGTELAGARPWQGMIELMGRLADLHCTLRVPGSGTATLAGVACGRGTAAIIHRYSPVDHAAAVIIVTEAGGTVLDSSGEPTIPEPGDVVIAGSDPAAARALWTEWRAARGGSRRGPRAPSRRSTDPSRPFDRLRAREAQGLKGSGVDQRRELLRTDVAAGQDHPDRAVAGRDLAGQQRRQRRGAAGLDHQLEPLVGPPHRLGQLGVADQQHRVEQAAVDREGELSRRRHGLTAGQGPGHRDRDPFPGRERSLRVVARLGLDPDHPDAGRQVGGDQRAARGQ